jgi:hypothetical protein
MEVAAEIAQVAGTVEAAGTELLEMTNTGLAYTHHIGFY